MKLSIKTIYALRALLFLAKQETANITKINEIAREEKIPGRFLELILNQLKKAYFIESKRGNDGGYRLIRPAQNLTVGEVVRCIQGPLRIAPTNAYGQSNPTDCVFDQLWEELQMTWSNVLDKTTFADLQKREMELKESTASTYVI